MPLSRSIKSNLLRSSNTGILNLETPWSNEPTPLCVRTQNGRPTATLKESYGRSLSRLFFLSHDTIHDPKINRRRGGPGVCHGGNVPDCLDTGERSI